MSVSPVSPALQRAYLQEREAAKRISQAHQNVKTAEQDASLNINQIRENAERQNVVESGKNQEAIDALRARNYNELRKLKQNHADALAFERRAGDLELTNLREINKDQINRVVREGRDHLRETQSDIMHRIEQEEHTSALALENLEHRRIQELNQMKQKSDQEIENERIENEKELAQFEEESREEKAALRSKVDNQLKTIIEENRTLMNRVGNTASDEIRKIRKDTFEKLAAYSSRQRDPFYKLVDLGARLTEDENSYTLKAMIPEHEQEHVSVSLNGNRIRVSGFRRNEEKLESDQGKRQESFSYQTYHESFPLTEPADPKQLTKHFEGSTLVVKVPKLKYQYKPYVAKSTQNVRAEIIKFPSNLQLKPLEDSTQSSDDHLDDSVLG